VNDPVKSERRGDVALLTLSRPDVLNALDIPTLESLGACVAAVADAQDVRALVVTGEGRAFCAGADIEGMREFTTVDAERFSALGHRVFAALEDLPIPTIAAVNGFALGGGCELSLACDFTYASQKAKFGQPEVKLGVIPGFGGTSRLVRRVGLAWAKEIAMLGEVLGADLAREIGLVNRVFEPDALLDAALAAGEAAAACGPLAVGAAKRVLQEGQGGDVRVAHALERAAFSALFGSEDRSEGMDAFLAKREPKFRAR
jgi:enoyl-CoA hydratase